MPDSKEAEMMTSGDVGSMIAAMLLEAGAHARETARRQKETALEREEQAETAKIHAMSSEASDRMWGGLADAAGGAVSGAAEISTAVLPNVNPKLLSGSGVGAKSGLQGLSSAYWNKNADDDKQDAAKADRKITQAKRNVESASDNDKDARDLIRRALDHYKDFISAKDEAKHAALFRA